MYLGRQAKKTRQVLFQDTNIVILQNEFTNVPKHYKALLSTSKTAEGGWGLSLV
jgi:ethanolamine utilization protein EutP (predicted NTPase)